MTKLEPLRRWPNGLTTIARLCEEHTIERDMVRMFILNDEPEPCAVPDCPTPARWFTHQPRPDRNTLPAPKAAAEPAAQFEALSLFDVGDLA